MNKYLILIIGLLVIASCKPTKEDRLKEIRDLERQTMMEAKTISDQRADSLLMMYDKFIEDFPTDSACVVMLYNASDICTNIDRCDKAINYLERLISDFDDNYMEEISRFKMGYIYEKACKDKEKAKQAYREFIDEYPKSDLATDATTMLEILDLTDSLIMRKFEAENDTTIPFE
ncbi:MAG: tetratricopeptide repeat protein [Bacteroidales bacterium]|jgi:outer membrane protein assembly factor BamD (BamD/ComL family)|nr:tetratricopeptide repeat protein [Bacteroidales bacterium]